MRYAIVLAGIPGTISNSLKDKLQERFSDNHIIRAAGARVYADNLTQYDDQVVDDSLRMAVDAVFGKSKRPNGFCRNTDRPCALHHHKKDSCGKTENESCNLVRPDFLVVLYQAGRDEGRLLERFHHSALAIRLPVACYGHLTRTLDASVDLIKKAYVVVGIIRKLFESSKTPLLLPIMNARNKHLNILFESAVRTGGKTESESFKRSYFDRASKAYLVRDPILFKPAEQNVRHGIPDPKNDDAIALSRCFRLGCQYVRDIHFDVHRKDGRSLSSEFSFHCRETGERLPKGKNVNVTVDDCLPWET